MKFENRSTLSTFIYKTDKRIVNYIRQNGYSDAFSTINSLAHAIGTSPATMTRFSHKLDYENFQDLKFNIQQEMKRQLLKIAQLFKEFINIINKSFNKLVNLLITTLSKTFIDKLQSSRHILFAGLGSSGLSATEFYYRMIRMG